MLAIFVKILEAVNEAATRPFVKPKITLQYLQHDYYFDFVYELKELALEEPFFEYVATQLLHFAAAEIRYGIAEQTRLAGNAFINLFLNDKTLTETFPKMGLHHLRQLIDASKAENDMDSLLVLAKTLATIMVANLPRRLDISHELNPTLPVFLPSRTAFTTAQQSRNLTEQEKQTGYTLYSIKNL